MSRNLSQEEITAMSTTELVTEIRATERSIYTEYAKKWLPFVALVAIFLYCVN